MDVAFGNLSGLDTQGTGWFIGFSDWCRSGGADLRHMPADMRSAAFSAKWFAHPAGHPNGEAKPLSEGRTVSILVGLPGEFRIDFSRDLAYPHDGTISHVLRDTGDYLAWGDGLYHRSFGVKPSCMLTLRWMPLP
jgi:hypothetical protein